MSSGGGLTLDDVSGLRVVDLKEALKQRDLPTDGKKVCVFICRLLATRDHYIRSVGMYLLLCGVCRMYRTRRLCLFMFICCCLLLSCVVAPVWSMACVRVISLSPYSSTSTSILKDKNLYTWAG